MSKKIIGLTLVIMLVLGILINNKVMAADSFSTIMGEANSWLEEGESNAGGIASEIGPVIEPIAQGLTTIGVGVLLVVAAVMGIKWITANPEEQAKLKQQMVGLVVAAVVVLGAYTIWSIVIDILDSIQ